MNKQRHRRAPRGMLHGMLALLFFFVFQSTNPAGLPPWLNAPDLTPAQKTLDAFRKSAPQGGIAHVPGFLWIDAEDFDDYGGWWIDTQFVAFMGSAYLIAAGVCQPVEDAVTTVAIPQAGRYRLWARTKNWIPEHAPGLFKINIHGQDSAHTFGRAKTADWTWEPGGEFDLPAGPVRIALRDLTGAYGRCDALILTTDTAYTPPAGKEAITQERARLTGLSLEPRDAGEYGVVVVGAGTAGCCAAIAAARQGARTVLIQDRPVLGGNASIEMGVPPQGASAKHANAREGGIMEEALRLTVAKTYYLVSDAFQELAEAETNLTVMLNERVIAVDMSSTGRIAAVQSVNTLSGEMRRMRGRQFIDCTGDGWVGFYAGAEYRLGRESRQETGEALAPEKGDNITMSGCIMGRQALSLRSVDTGKPTKYTPPPWAAKLPPPEEFGRHIKSVISGNWWLEHEGTIDDLNDPEKARDELIRITFGYWDFIKNRWEERARATRFELVHVPIWNAKRETRRLMGDHVLTQQDVQNAEPFPDRIAYGGWTMDIHHPRGIYSGKDGPYDFDAPTPLYSIPYRCLYSRNISNLLFAGRNASVTHVALGTIRVESTLATLGQAAGTAAALCIQHRVDPRDIYTKHIQSLQQTLLRNDQYIPDIINADPADLARQAKVSASSTATCKEFSKNDVYIDRIYNRDYGTHELKMPRAVILPTGLNAEIKSVWLLVKSAAAQPVKLTARLCSVASFEAFSQGKELKTAQATIAPNKEQWVAFDFNATIPDPFFGVWLEPAKDVFWLLMKTAPPGSGRAFGGSASRPWTLQTGQFYAIYTHPSRTFPLDVAPEKVIDGISRIVKENLHVWSSDPQQPLPQWLELDLGMTRPFNTVQLTFDTDMNVRWPAKPLARQCVRDYEVLCEDGLGGWRTLVAVKDNFQRWRTHRFPTVSAQKLRIRILATHGDPAARLFEVRLYHD